MRATALFKVHHSDRGDGAGGQLTQGGRRPDSKGGAANCRPWMLTSAAWGLAWDWSGAGLGLAWDWDAAANRGGAATAGDGGWQLVRVWRHTRGRRHDR